MRNRVLSTALALATTLVLFSSCGEQSGSVPEVAEAELTASVPELDAVHEFMQPLWHDAFPAKDFAAIQDLVPRFEPTLEALDAVVLPGILRDKQADWDEGKANLKAAFDGLRTAAEAGNEAEMLGYAEAFHMGYEHLVRIVRPVVPELDAFHQHLYSVYHHYGPGYDLEKIRASTESMAAAVPPLQAVELPSRVAEHQADFENLVVVLGEEVHALLAALENPRRSEVEAAIDAVHTAYANVEALFN